MVTTSNAKMILVPAFTAALFSTPITPGIELPVPLNQHEAALIMTQKYTADGIFDIIIPSSIVTLHKEEILSSFAKKLLENIKDVDPEITNLVNNNFWDLV